MIRRNLLKILIVLCVLLTVFFVLGFCETLAETDSSGLEEVWNADFSGEGDDELTFRTYLSIDVYDGSGEYLGNLPLTQKTGGALDGTYVLKHNGVTFLEYKNNGNSCNIKTRDDGYTSLFGQLLYGHEEFGGHQSYKVLAHMESKLFSRQGPSTAYETWESLDEAYAAGFGHDFDGTEGARSRQGRLLVGFHTLNGVQIDSLVEIYGAPWNDTIQAVGSTCTATYDANGGKFVCNEKSKLVETFDSYPADGEFYTGTDEIPERGDYYFWGWTKKKYGLDKGPKDALSEEYVLMDTQKI